MTSEREKGMIVINNLTKKYGDSIALDNIDLRMESGRIYGLIGRNGSGKTMLLRHIAGLTYPTDGYVEIDGKKIGSDIEAPDNIGAVIENPGFLLQFTGFRNLKLLALLRNKISEKEIKDAMKTVGLDPENPKKLSAYSLGMKQRLGLAQAIMEKPDILLLDEPMNGLDNEGVEQIRKVLIQQKAEGKTIILASHSREDIEILCDETILLDKGRIIERRKNK